MALFDVLKDEKLVLTLGGIALFFGLTKYADKFNPVLLMVIGSSMIIFRRQIVRWL